MSNPKIVTELRRIAADNGGVLNAADVVEAARPKNSPLHSRFEWNDTEAARHYRMVQARHLIALTVEYVNVSEPPQLARIFVSLVKDRTEGGGYRELEAVMANERDRALLLDDALVDMKRFQRKYADLRILGSVFQAMNDTMGKVKAGASRKRSRQPQPVT